MKIPRSEVVRRFLVVFDEQEAMLLIYHGILPLTYRPEQELWFTQEEMKGLEGIIPTKTVNDAINQVIKESVTK